MGHSGALGRIFALLKFLALFWLSAHLCPEAQASQSLEKTVSQPAPALVLQQERGAKPEAATPPDFDGRWKEFAAGLSEITSAAVSPLLVVSLIGANRYFRTPAGERHKLPFFCNPLLWGTGISLLLVCFLKDSVGTVLPTPLKKTLDMLELFENKLSALVAATLFVPVIAWQMSQHLGSVSAGLGVPADVQLASIFPGSAGGMALNWLVIPLSVLSFFTVWLTSNVINVLVAICPFGVIDAFLKLFKSALLAALVVASVINPYLGALLSGLLLLFAILMAGRAFRFSVFGLIFASDVLLLWRPKRGAVPGSARVFTTKRAGGVPARTYGRLTLQSGGGYAFHYRPWLIFPVKEVVLPDGVPVFSKGLLSVSLLLECPSGQTVKVVEFLPRYRRHLETLAAHFRVAEIRDGAVVGGIKALWRWMLEVLNLKARQPDRA